MPPFLCFQKALVFASGRAADVAYSRQFADVQLSVNLIHNFHYFAAAAGDNLTCLYFQDFVADGAVDITVLFCPYYRQQTFFEFHKFTSIEKKAGASSRLNFYLT